MKKSYEFLKDITFKIYLKGLILCSCIIGTPLFLHQFPRLRSGCFWYPIFLFVLCVATSLLLGFISGRSLQQEVPLYHRILLGVSCCSAGFFPVWLATFGPEVLGRNAWRGNVLLVNIVMGFLGLIGGMWAALAIRWLQQKSFSCKKTAFMTGGAIGIYGLGGMIGRIQGTPSFSAMFKVFSQGVWNDYIFYFFWEALAWRIVWPCGFIAGLILYIFQEKIFCEEPQNKQFKAKRAGSWWD